MVAVITGASKGIGYAIAQIYAANGYDLALNSRNEEELQEVSKQLQKEYKVSVKYRVTDMSDKSAVMAFAEWLNGAFEKVDVLVNNAGVFIPGNVHEEEEGHLEKMIETNLYSAYHLSRAIIPRMVKQKQGHIFNICSVASLIAYPNGGSYSISKFALYGLTKVLREELKDKGIRVTAILPGATWSNSWAGVELPESRLMLASDIAKCVFNASELSPAAVVEDIIIRPQLGDL